ncbi:MAG: 5-formyltetrahydrofolate cyclo-ligase, partial [Candidatus Saelkia tenebricola]|nr:5-formyltetrahydrofolate cyclo-ligase [Candidatus Saelkia tenebricola]
MDEKSLIRGKMFLELKNLENKEKERRNARIKEKLFSNIKFKNANLIMSYVSKPYEVDTWRIIEKSLEMGKKIAV